MRGALPSFDGHWLVVVDHPRVCGEHLTPLDYMVLFLGSSPRMRGAQNLESCLTFTHGIIPAYAGSTLILSAFYSLIRDHPRVCGEHTKKSQFRIPQSYN